MPAIDWLTLPAWNAVPTQIEVPEYIPIEQYEAAKLDGSRSAAALLELNATYQVRLPDLSCSCSPWNKRSRFPVGDLRRVCKHLAKAINHRHNEFQGNWNPWTERILAAIERGESRGVATQFTHALFSNGIHDFLAIYNNERGYVELFESNGSCYGYDGAKNRWAYGEGPENPLAIKKNLRPWIHALDEKYQQLQRDFANEQYEKEKRSREDRAKQHAEANDKAQFPLDELGAPYRLQDFDRIHPGLIHFRKHVTASVFVVSRSITEEVRQILRDFPGLLPLDDDPVASFFHLQVDGMNHLLRFEGARVRVVFRRPLKKKIEYSHEIFYPAECRWGREGEMPARGLLVRGLIYDFLHGVELGGDRTDFDLSEGPYIPDWEAYKKHPLERAPYPPLPSSRHEPAATAESTN